MMLRPQWCEMPEFREWLRPVEDDKSLGSCLACESKLKLSKAGIGALKVHSMSDKHKINLELYRLRNLQNCLQPISETDVSREDFNQDSASQSPGGLFDFEPAFTSGSNVQDAMDQEDDSSVQCISETCQSPIQYITPEIGISYINEVDMKFKGITDSDINRILDFVSKRISSDHSRIMDCLNSAKLLPIQKRIANFFNCLLTGTLETVEHCVLLLNERFSKTSACKQIDTHVRYFNNIQNKVETRYWFSVCIEPNDTLNIESFDFKPSVIQLCLSGYSLKIPEKRETDGQMLTFTSLLFCVQNAFKHGEIESGMKIGELLRNLENFFEDSPEITAEFIKKSKSKLIPLPFTRHELKNNIEAATRAVEIWTEVKDFIDHYALHSHSESYSFLKKACHDTTTEDKLKFYISVAEMAQSLVDFCKSEKPFLPLVAERLLKFVRDCLGDFCILKEEYIPKTVDSLTKLHLGDFSRYCQDSEVKIGVSGEKMLEEFVNRNLLTFRELINFKTQAQVWIISMIRKLIHETIGRSPIILALSCLNPSHMIKDRKDCVSKMRTLLYEFSNSSNDLNEILRLFREFLDDILDQDDKEFNGFDHTRAGDRLDTLLHARMVHIKYRKLWDFVKMILILYNGQVPFENMYEESSDQNLWEDYVDRLMILDHMRCVWGEKSEEDILTEITQFANSLTDDLEVQ